MESNSDENGFEAELLSEIEVWSLGLENIETNLELPPDLQSDVLDPIEHANAENAQAVQPASDQQAGGQDKLRQMKLENGYTKRDDSDRPVPNDSDPSI